MSAPHRVAYILPAYVRSKGAPNGVSITPSPPTAEHQEHLPIGPALPKNPLQDVASSLAVQPLCR